MRLVEPTEEVTALPRERLALLALCDRVRRTYHGWMEHDTLDLARTWVERAGMSVDPEWIDCLQGRGKLSAWLRSIDDPADWQERLLAAAPIPRLHGFGYWRSGSESHLPMPVVAKPRLDRRTRETVAAYLVTGVEWIAFAGYSFCRVCGRSDETMGSRELSDGVWIWPEGLVHYVTAHHTALPRAFLDHVSSRPRVDTQHVQMLRALGAWVSLECWYAWSKDAGALDGSDRATESSQTAPHGWFATNSLGTRGGPFTEDQIREMLRSGSIKPYYRLWKLGIGPERKARDVPPFSELCRSIPPEPL